VDVLDGGFSIDNVKPARRPLAVLRENQFGKIVDQVN